MFTVFIFSGSTQAKTTDVYVIPGGDSIGLQLSTGIYITGKYDVKTNKGDSSPWEKANLEVGDKIVSINNKSVNTIEELQKILPSIKDNEEVVIKVVRDGQSIITATKVIQSTNGKKTLGLYVKDEVLGVGTVTFINPKNNNFGALGHSIVSDQMAGKNLGYISSSTVNGIRKSLPGIPGEKQATMSSQSLGVINKNSDIGVFGKLNSSDAFTKEEVMKVASPNEVKIGSAFIWTVLESNKKESFEVQIIEVKNQTSRGIKGIKIQITDKRLLDKTGGIIQGMSGSPIIQNNMLIGAVSHVVIDSPEYGYGVFAKWMFEDFLN